MIVHEALGRYRARAILPALCVTLAACDDDNRRPYTPFTIPSTNEPVASAIPSAAPVVKPKFTPKKSVKAPERATRWQLEGHALAAPKGRYFDTALIIDLDPEPSSNAKSQRDPGPQRAQVVAWTLPKKPHVGISPGELWLYHAGAEPRKVSDFPSFLPTGPDCQHTSEILHTGPRSITLDIRTQCRSTLVPRAALRSLAVLAPKRSKPQILTVRLAAAAPDEALEVEVTSLDRDNDGRDDAELRVTVRAAGTKKDATAIFRWLDRSAGTSRDPSQPRQAFTDIGSVEVVRAGGANTSKHVPERLNNARRLFSSVCAESGVARLFDDAGRPFSCGDLTQAFTWYMKAEVESALTRGQPEVALAALLGARHWPAHVPREALAKLRRRVDNALTLKPFEVRRRVAARPRARGSLPRYSPLAFDTDSSLLVQTVTGVRRVTAEEEADASEEVDPWPLTVIGPKRQRLLGVQASCDRSEIVLLASDRLGKRQVTLPTPLLAPRPGGCRGGPAPSLRFAPIAWRSALPDAFILGSRIGHGAPKEPPYGSARNGSYEVAATDAGLLVKSKNGVELWTHDDAALVKQLDECVIDAQGRNVACLQGERALWLTPR